MKSAKQVGQGEKLNKVIKMSTDVQVKISIAKEFTATPGGRYKRQGRNSGEEFREKFLEKHFAPGKTEKLIIDLDGTLGYATSFLDEAFGGLARKYGAKAVRDRISFISEEERLLPGEILQYINEANETK